MTTNARNSDPDSSHAAGGSNAARIAQKARLLVAFGEFPDLNAYEAAIAADIDPNGGSCSWHRVTDLCAEGLIENVLTPSGKNLERPGQFPNRGRMVYRITARGRENLAARAVSA